MDISKLFIPKSGITALVHYRSTVISYKKNFMYNYVNEKRDHRNQEKILMNVRLW